MYQARTARLQDNRTFAKVREVGKRKGRPRFGLPTEGIDVLIDDADHFLTSQLANLELWFPKVRPGGLYIIEDVYVGRFPWKGQGPDDIVPTNNTRCGNECFFTQRPADHPFLSNQPPAMRELLAGRNWFFSITGTHRGGGGSPRL